MVRWFSGKKKSGTGTAYNRLLRKVHIFPRLFCIMLLLTVLPTIFITYVSFHEYVAEIKENTEHFISLLVGNVSVQVRERLETYEQSARAFYSDPEILEYLMENAEFAKDPGFQTHASYLENKCQIERRLFDMTGNSKYILNLEFITDYDQYFMRNSNGEQRGCMLHDREAFLNSGYYERTLTEKGYPCWFDTTQTDDLIYKYDYSTHGILDTLTMTAAVYRPDTRELLGILMFNLDTGFLTQSLTNYAFYGTGNTFLLGKKTVIGALNPNLNAPTFTDKSSMQKQIQEGKKGSFEQKQEGRNLFVSYQKSGKMDLYIVHIVDMDTLLKPAYTIRNRCLLLVGVLLLLCIGLARMTTKSISMPLQGLLKSMECFGRNEFQERCETEGRDELTIVSRGFNQMAEDTERMVQEIVTANIREKTLELNKATAELNALQMQIRPHFMYNTLDLIRWEMIRAADGESNASHMLDSFCQLMRMSVTKDNEMVPLETELAHARVYIDVVNFRNTEKIKLETAVYVKPSASFLPKLTLQPLIENAVLHGFKKHMKHPAIQIEAWHNGNKLFITVKDNGKGMDRDQLDTLKQSFCGNEMLETSIGLRNVNQRFKLLYGDSYGVSVESEPGVWTKVTICMPFDG